MRRALPLLLLALAACPAHTAHRHTRHHKPAAEPGVEQPGPSEQPDVVGELPARRPGNHYRLSTVEPLAVAANLPPDAPLPPPAADAPPARMRVHLIDVGQGLAVLLEFSCAAVLVDTGGETNGLFDSGRALQLYLLKFFVRRPDLHNSLALLVLTHPHADHTLNTEMVAETYTVQNVVTDGLTEGSGKKGQIFLHEWAESHKLPLFKVDADQVPAGGLTNAVIDPVRCADVDPKISVLWGAPGEMPDHWSNKAYKSGNNQSVVLRVGFGKAVVLLTGDAEGEALHSMLERHAGVTAATGASVVKSDVWQVSHHGSEHGATQEFVDATAPAVALLATGSPERQIPWTAWAYGHPRAKVVEMLSQKVTGTRPAVEVEVAEGQHEFHKVEMKQAIYATGWDGSVLVDVDADGKVAVRTTK